MVAKSRSNKSPSADALFNNALPAFKKELQNRFNDRSEELRDKTAKIIMTESRKDQISDPIYPMYALYKEHAQKIGEDFLSVFDSIIRPFCGIISDYSKVVLTLLFLQRYQNAITRTENGLRRLALSLGRQKDFFSILAPARGIYGRYQSKYHNRLDAEILKHNLEMGLKEVGENKEKTSMSKNNAVEYTPQTKKNNRKRRTIVELEVITPKIVEAFEEIHDGEGLSIYRTFQKLADQSSKRFGEKLTAGQLRGLYDRKDKYLQ
jgi:hypothetical protein